MLAFQTSHCPSCLINIGMYEMSHARCCSGSTVFRDKALPPSVQSLLARRAQPSGSRPRRTRSSIASRTTGPGGLLAPRAPAPRLAAASQPQHRTQSQEQHVNVVHCTRGHVYWNPSTSRCRNTWVCRNSLTLPCFLQIVQISILGMCIICISK